MPVSEQLTTTKQIFGEVIRVGDVSDNERDAMYLLMCQYFDNMCRPTYERDFAEKDWVIIARNPSDNRIIGFSTQLLTNIDSTDGVNNLDEARKIENIDRQRDGISSRPKKILFSGVCFGSPCRKTG